MCNNRIILIHLNVAHINKTTIYSGNQVSHIIHGSFHSNYVKLKKEFKISAILQPTVFCLLKIPMSCIQYSLLDYYFKVESIYFWRFKCISLTTHIKGYHPIVTSSNSKSIKKMGNYCLLYISMVYVYD